MIRFGRRKREGEIRNHEYDEGREFNDGARHERDRLEEGYKWGVI